MTLELDMIQVVVEHQLVDIHLGDAVGHAVLHSSLVEIVRAM